MCARSRWHYDPRETLIKYRTVRCVRGGWMQAARRRAGWNLRKASRPRMPQAGAGRDAKAAHQNAYARAAMGRSRPKLRPAVERPAAPQTPPLTQPADMEAQLRDRRFWPRAPSARPSVGRLHGVLTDAALGQNRSVAQRET